MPCSFDCSMMWPSIAFGTDAWPHRLAEAEMEYTTLPDVIKCLRERFVYAERLARELHYILLIRFKYSKRLCKAMNLPDNERRQFLRLYNSLLVYVNNKYKIVQNLSHHKDIFDQDPEEVERLKERLYSDPGQIDSYVQENPAGFSDEELKIISSWRHFIKGRFYLIRFMKSYAVFLDESHPPRAYGVKGLAMQWDLVTNLPRILEATLIPFKDKIIFDGAFSCYNLFFGPEMKRNILDRFRQAKAGYGIITSLPFSPEESASSDSERLRGFLSSQESRDIHWQEVEEMICKDPGLLPVYSQEMGKVHARRYRKRLREIGIKEGWFATIEGIIIAGGPAQEEVEKAVAVLLPPEKRKLVYIFHLK